METLSALLTGTVIAAVIASALLAYALWKGL